jgi:hypothetical protein
LDKLIETLKKSLPVEKTRWFKKNALKEEKHNMNPLEIFSSDSSVAPNCLDYVKSLSGTQEKLNLDHLELFNALRQTKIFESILKLQMLH